MTLKVTVPFTVISALCAAFEAAWKGFSSAIELSEPRFDADGVEYHAELSDPFSGTSRGRYLFEWAEIEEVLVKPREIMSIHESVSEWLSEMGDCDGTEAELTVDADGRVHDASMLKWQREG